MQAWDLITGPVTLKVLLGPNSVVRRRQTLPATGLHIVGAGRLRLHSHTYKYSRLVRMQTSVKEGANVETGTRKVSVTTELACSHTDSGEGGCEC